MRVLWNRLVDIERDAELRQRTLAEADDSDLAALFIRITSLSAQIREAKTRADARKLVIERHTIERETWPHLAAWRRANPQAVLRIEQTRRAQVIAARQSSECYWCNYNRVIDDYEIARRTVRQFGRRLRKIKTLDSGCLTVQIQRTLSGLGASPRELLDGTFPHVQIGAIDSRAHDRRTFRGERSRLCRTKLSMRIDAQGHHAVLPMVYHRPLLPGSRIKEAQITWRTNALGETRWRVCFTCSTANTIEQKRCGATAKIRLGWERENGELLIVGGAHRLALDQRWMSGMDRVQTLSAAGDKLAAECALSVHHVEEHWRAVRALHESCQRASDQLEWWYARADRWVRELTGLRDRLLGQRRERYRLWALNLVIRYARVVIEAPVSLAAHMQAHRGSDANSLLQRAALHELIAIIRHMGAKHHCTVEIASAPAVAEIDLSKIRHISRWQREKLESARKMAIAADINQ